MCDYSLHVGIATRPAEVGDELVSRQFLHAIARGFGDLNDPHIAVCLRPGTELAFNRDVELDYGFGRILPFFGIGRIRSRVARFCQIKLSWSSAQHDALEFPDGRVVRLTRLCAGQHARVLQLPAGPLEELRDEEHQAGAARAKSPVA